MKIANIVTNNKIDVDGDINVVSDFSDIIGGIPTLVTSYDWVINNYEDYDFYDKQLADNLFWTFAKTERRDIFTKDVEDFITFANRALTSKITYVFVDPIQLQLDSIKKIITKIYGLKNKVAFKTMDMIYIYGENLIFGIDLNLLKYIGINVVKVERKIKKICDVFLDDKEIFIEYKSNMERLNDSVKYIPYLYSIKHE
jgi:hypothetical protein